MNKNALLVVAALCAAGMLCAATPDDFAIKILPASAVAVKGAPGSAATGSVDLTVALTTAIDETQGWSFGAIVAPAAGATMRITALTVAADTMTMKAGGPPSFTDTAFYAAGNLATPAGKADEATGIAVIEIPDCVAITHGVVIDFAQKVTLAASTDFELTALTVETTATVGDVEAEVGQVVFTDAVGEPPTASVVVHGGNSIAPAVMAPAVLKAVPAVCATAKDFSIWLSSAECATGATVESLVTLNFNGNGTNEGAAIQGWSYGVCTDGLLVIDEGATTSTGTDVATIKNGAEASFDTITVYPGEGVTHGIVIDFAAKVTLPAVNHFSDLRIFVTANVTEESPLANLRPCDLTLGTPPTANVMVISGNSIAGSTFDGVLADREGDTGCCPEALAGEGTACNKPAEITYSAGFNFRPGNANGDGKLDLADGIFILSYMYRGGRAPGCEAALDVNLDGVIDSSDAIMIFYWQFLDGPAPALGTECGTFKTDLSCNVQEEC